MVTITYNGQVLPNVYDKFEFSETYTDVTFSCSFLVTSDTEDNLVAACKAIEQNLSIWNGEFLVEWGDNNVQDYSLSHANNTGFLARPELKKLTNNLSTGTSRPYSLTINFQLPARQGGYDYRQSSNISLDTNYQQRKILTVTGVYTAGGADNALKNFYDNGRLWSDGLAASLLGPLNYEKLDEKFTYDQENKVLHFVISYQEKLSVSIEYNGYVIPGGYYNFQHSISYTNASVSLDFSIEKINEDDVLVFLTEKDAKLEIIIGTKTYTYDPLDNTGFLIFPRIRKIDNLEEDNTKVFYNFSADIRLPARITADFFRQSASFNINYTSSRRRRIDFEVTYTASDGKKAIENYNDSINGAKAWALGVLSSLGFTVSGAAKNIELLTETIGEEHREKIANGKFSYQEILSSESDAAKDYSAIVDDKISYSVEFMQEIGEEITSGFVQVPVHTVNINYDCKIDQEVIAADSDINSVYRDIVRPYVIGRCFIVTGLSDSEFDASIGPDYYMLSEKYSVNASEFSVSGTMTFRVPKTVTGHILSVDEKITTSKETGKNFVKVWDGKPNTYAIWGIGVFAT